MKRRNGTASHAIWSGSITFGLVAIPVRIFSAVHANELHFHYLHKKDLGRIHNVRQCALDGDDVDYSDIIRGFEIEKGQYVTLEPEDFESAAVQRTQSVEIFEFVDLSEINPVYFDAPYYLEPEKKGRHAYALLREAMRLSEKVGISKVVLRAREHLAALKPQGDALVLEMMHYPDEIVPAESFDFPETEKISTSELRMAKLLIENMAASFEPSKYHDTYRERVLAMIEARASGAAVSKGRAKVPAPTNVIDLMDVLQKSLERGKGGERKKTPRRKRPAA